MPYYTAQDAVDHLLTMTNGGAQDGEHRVIRAAVHHAYREVCESRDWLWHVKIGQFYTNGGSFAVYNHSSGSQNLYLPANCNLYLQVGASISDAISSYIPGGTTVATISSSTTNITVNGNTTEVRQITISAAPTGVLTSVSSPTRSDYDLPSDVQNMDALLSQSIGTLRYYVTPTDYERLQINSSMAGSPFYFTVMRVGDNQNLTVRFVGQPTAQLLFAYTYRARPKPLVLMGFEPSCRNGTISVAGAAVTGTSTTFPERAVDAILRVSNNSANYPESLSGLYPYYSEQQIKTWNTGLSLTLDAAMSPSPAGSVRYYISDVLDVSPGMYTAVLSGAMLWHARLSGRPLNDADALYTRDMRLAMERDVTNPYSGRRDRWVEYPLSPRLMGYYSTQMPDQGA